MNLRQAKTAQESDIDAQGGSGFSTMNFVAPSSFIGNIGDVLDYGQGQDFPEDQLDTSQVAGHVSEQPDRIVIESRSES